MTRNFTIVAALVIVTASLAGGVRTRTSRRVISTNVGNSNQTTTAEKYEADKIENDYHEAISTVEEKYAGDIDYEKATQAAIQGMLFTLDPHSVFFSTTEFRKLKEDQASSFYGIGVQIQRHDDGVYVQSVVEGTPASRAGLRFGDRIVEVDGKDARDWSSDEVSKNVRGIRGEAVKLKVERAGEEAPVNVKIVRDSVPLPSIRNAFMLGPGTGYVGLIGGFQHTSDDELREDIANLKKEGMRQMVLDLRNNPGGLLDQAIDVSSEFLPRDKVIVSVKGRSEYHEPAVYKSNGTDPEELPLVVLSNRNTASASEIVAGAIQDHGRGLVVGETSFGKGLVQHIFQLPFNTGLTLTTARYYTPYGRSLQRDYSSGSLYDYYVRHDQNDNQQPIQPGQPSPNESVAPRSSNAPAFRTAAGRIFYGGGGITPDIEARPLTATPTRGRIIEAAFYFTRTLAAGKVAGLESYRVDKVEYGHTPKAGDYVISDRVLEAFRNYLRKEQSRHLQVAQIEADLDFVKLRLREEIITAAFGADAGQRVLLESDPQTLRAIGVLPDAKRLAESVRNGTPLTLNFKLAYPPALLPFLPGIEEQDEILI
ncbi:MAG: carboxyl-terminal processing protease [Blastocatellia bacterium]|jgi:carboxyl-terminal processing protease|nr:carboxyl-terminal processing protease [Blastocatellia bacterium]